MKYHMNECKLQFTMTIKFKILKKKKKNPDMSPFQGGQKLPNKFTTV